MFWFGFLGSGLLIQDLGAKNCKISSLGHMSTYLYLFFSACRRDYWHPQVVWCISLRPLHYVEKTFSQGNTSDAVCIRKRWDN